MLLTDIYLGLGSNIDRETHLLAALDQLQQRFGPLNCSPVFESEPVGIRSGCFLNMVVHIRTDLAPGPLVALLKDIEKRQGRYEAGPRQLPLDIDVLLYGTQVGVFDGVTLPRPRMLESAHVVWPLALLAPELRHPGLGSNYSSLWQAMPHGYGLWPYALSWNGRALTPAHLLTAAAPA